MDQKEIFGLCKKLGCCDACGLRYLGIRNPKAYENIKESASKFHDAEQSDNTTPVETNGANSEETEPASSNGGPPNKKHKCNPCVTCLGLLQSDGWPECNQKVKEVLDKKRYECTTFACALSAPIVTILREKVVSLRLKDACKDYDPTVLCPLKEAWKWSYGVQLASFLDRPLDAGNVSPLLVTLNMEYQDDLQELEILKAISPALFKSRSQQRRRFTVEFTRRSVEQAIEDMSVGDLRDIEGWREGMLPVGSPAQCVSVATAHAPVYLGGRYIKLSRELPQTPWVVGGRRVMPSSVQEIIFEPLARKYDMSLAESEHRLKFMSAGREDVDVRCLGDGRPFAIEVTDPRRQLTAEELQEVCQQISKSGQVVVNKLVNVTKDDLAELKKGEETKCKTYEALCIKLTHSSFDDNVLNGDGVVTVTPSDICRLASFRNTDAGDDARVALRQKTPIRVLHRRPLLVRTRYIYDIEADQVAGHPQLIVLRVRTSAGAYVKEAVHGELGRTRPALQDALGAQLDLLALDVATVHLDWPKLTR